MIAALQYRWSITIRSKTFPRGSTLSSWRVKFVFSVVLFLLSFQVFIFMIINEGNKNVTNQPCFFSFTAAGVCLTCWRAFAWCFCSAAPHTLSCHWASSVFSRSHWTLPQEDVANNSDCALGFSDSGWDIFTVFASNPGCAIFSCFILNCCQTSLTRSSFQSLVPTISWLRMTNPSLSVLEGLWPSAPLEVQTLVLTSVGTSRNLDSLPNYSYISHQVASLELQLDSVAVDLVLDTL